MDNITLPTEFRDGGSFKTMLGLAGDSIVTDCEILLLFYIGNTWMAGGVWRGREGGRTCQQSPNPPPPVSAGLESNYTQKAGNLMRFYSHGSRKLLWKQQPVEGLGRPESISGCENSVKGWDKVDFKHYNLRSKTDFIAKVLGSCGIQWCGFHSTCNIDATSVSFQPKPGISIDYRKQSLISFANK